jgi:hypothetical protein
MFKVETPFIGEDGKEAGKIALLLDDSDVEEFKKCSQEEQLEWLHSLGESNIDLDVADIEAGKPDMTNLVISNVEVQEEDYLEYSSRDSFYEDIADRIEEEEDEEDNYDDDDDEEDDDDDEDNDDDDDEWEDDDDEEEDDEWEDDL